MTPRSTPLTTVGTTALAAAIAISAAPGAHAEERSIKAYTTGYTWYDNTPRGSSVLSDPVIHKVTSGTGTAKDPITVAVGHSFATGKDVLDYPAGTRMYIPALRKYFVVEDTCGDGDTPQNGPCHTGYKQDGHTYPWLDLWIDGASSTEKAATACASHITAVHTVILDPTATYAVDEGSVTGSGCHLYSEKATTATPSPAELVKPAIEIALAVLPFASS